MADILGGDTTENIHNIRELQRQYLDFLDDEQDSGKNYDKAKKMIEYNETRLIININDLRKKIPDRAASLLKNGFEELTALQKAVKEYIEKIDPTYAKEHDEFFVAFCGSFGSKHVTPRTLCSRYLNNIVCVEGIVIKCSFPKLKVVRSVHYCPTTEKFMERKYSDLTSTDSFPSSTVYPTKDDDGNLLETEFGLSKYKDHQTLTIQEMPEKAPVGQLPRSVEVICDNDLVDLCKPGDRVQVVGCYRCLPGKHGGFTSGIFRTVVIANTINKLSVEAEQSITSEDITKCRRLAKRKDIFDLLSKSLAPSICGHEYVKKGILCLLLGGTEKVLQNGTRLRGDINILLIGDPSVAKSQLLRYVLQTAPRAISTTGRGSSGVGLTAAVTTDQETGERRLEAGAMVLGDRGVVCIDEFDKMTDMDRTAIHEVMEQGQVTIAKAGIHARLNARCSVLAAANPVYGKYDQYKTPMENIGLQDSLLSRFDLLYVLLDLVDTENDKKISDHVVRMHRYRNPWEQDGEVLPMGSSVDMLTTANVGNDEDDERVDVFEKYDPLLHGNLRAKTDQILSVKFMKKYLLLSKNLKAPELTEEASEIIAEEYSRLRSQDTMNSDVARTQPITARTVETLIRLSTAHAKARLSRTIDASDAKTAIELVQYAIFRKVLDKKDKKRRRNEDGEESEEEEVDEEIPESDQPRSKRTRSGPITEYEQISSQDQPAPTLKELREKKQTRRVTITEERLKSFKEAIVKIFMDQHEESLPVATVLDTINKDRSDVFTEDEIEAGIDILSEANQIMRASDTLYLI